MTGQVAVVIDCRRGIGLVVAEALAAVGAGVIGVSASLERGRGRIPSSPRTDLPSGQEH